VGVGLHTGECVVRDGRTTGEAVDGSERLARLAAPGEILVSSTVRDLVGGSGIPLEAREDREVFAVA
jgi:class 3 adenylate cyclase